MIGIILLLIGGGLIYLAYIITQANKERAKIQGKEAEEYIKRASGNKSVSEIQTDVFLQKNEKAILESENSSLQETRVVRKISGGGAGIRVAKGVTVGKFGSTPHCQQAIYKSTLQGYFCYVALSKNIIPSVFCLQFFVLKYYHPQFTQ